MTFWRPVLRALFRKPAMAVAIALTASVGLSANVVLLIGIDIAIFRPLQIPEADSIIHAEFSQERFLRLALTDRSRLVSLRDQIASSRLFETSAYLHRDASALTAGISTEAGVRPVLVSSSFFEAIRVRPKLGRACDAGDLADSRRSVVISEDLWTRLFGADPSVIGTVVHLSRGGSDAGYRLLGVMTQGFSFPRQSNVWFLDGDRAAQLFEDATRAEPLRVLARRRGLVIRDPPVVE